MTGARQCCSDGPRPARTWMHRDPQAGQCFSGLGPLAAERRRGKALTPLLTHYGARRLKLVFTAAKAHISILLTEADRRHFSGCIGRPRRPMAHDDPTMLMPDAERPEDYFVEVEVIGQIDRYHLVRLLGSGAFGAVYLAYDSVAGIQVALKSIPRVVTSHSDALELTRRNFSLVTHLSHPNITTIRHLHEAVDVDDDARGFMGVNPGDYLIVMDVAQGMTLNKLRRQYKRAHLPLGTALTICRQVATALDYAHGQNIIHRDIKPGNIVVNDNLHAEVLDFGLAASIEESVAKYSRELQKICGTKQYMAPEQWTGTKQGPATDQYSLAVVFYELLHGNVPFADTFKSDEREGIAETVLSTTVPPLKQLTRRQNRVLQRALAKHPDDRFPSCTAFIKELQGARQTAADKIAPVLLVIGLLIAVVFVGAMVLRPEWFTNGQDPDKGGPAVVVSPRAPDDLVALQSRATVLRQQVARLNRGHGFADRIEAFLVRFETGSTYLEKRDFSAARREFDAVVQEAEELLAQDHLRRRALADRKGLVRLKQRARRVKAKRLAPSDMADAVKAEADAATAMAQAEFETARTAFGAAREALRQAISNAEQYARAAAAKDAWETALAEVDVGLLNEHGGQAWEDLSFAVRVAERQRNEGEYRKAIAVYRKAPDQLAGVAAAARLARAEAARLKDLDEHFVRVQETMQTARELRTDYSRRKEVLKLYDKAAAVLNRLLKAKEFPKESWDRAADLQDEVKNALSAIENGPKELFPWTLALGAELELELAHIPAGDFMLGSTREERVWVEKRTGKTPVNEGEEPRQAEINQAFWMARTEVTVAQFEAYVRAAKAKTQADRQRWAWTWDWTAGEWRKQKNANWERPGYPYELKPTMPVVNCSWEDARAFCAWLTRRERDAGRLPPDLEYRLPTEAEWEYACRAGQKGRPRFWWGDDWADAEGKANVRDATPIDAENKIVWTDAAEWEDQWSFAAPVDRNGKAGRNPFGLADMLGNVAEWVLDGYDEKQAGIAMQAPITPLRVIRGGSYRNGLFKSRNASRAGAAPDTVRQDIGFRVVCGPVIAVQD